MFTEPMKISKLTALIGPLLVCVGTWASPSSVPGIDLDNFDNAVRPQDNLFLHVNGAWLKKIPIPADKGSYGAFDKLRDLSDERVHDIIKTAVAQRAAPGSEAQKIADLYQSFMDEAAIEKRGLTPLQDELAAVDKLGSTDDLAWYFGKMQRYGVDMPLTLGIEIDAKDSRRYLPAVGQSGLGLPDRDYYLQNDPRFVKAREAYLAYLTRLFTLSGQSDPAGMAKAVLALETALAKAQWSNVENRDPVKTYNKMTPVALRKLAPGFNWPNFLSAGKLNVTELDLAQPSYARQLGVLVAEQPISAWRAYLKARLLDSAAPFLSQDYVDAQFAFAGTALNGTTENLPRWQRAVGLTQAGLGDAVGKLYVAKYFPPEHKARMEALVANLMKAYAQSIDQLAWMSPETKKQAQDKLAKYNVKIGYPNKWLDYSALQIEPDDLFGNVQRLAEFGYNYELSKLNKPVDRDEWEMTPQTVNAYYNPQRNEIVFPAAILQPPFFDINADDAVNYGGIGAVIGHEISHGFDDQGSQFDGDGNLHDWWKAEDKRRFKTLADKLVAQYAAYEPLPGMHINGQLTLGENIADNSGLQIAHKAYLLALDGQAAPVLDGMSGDQRFFVSFAQIWRNKMREETLLQLSKTDPHSPPEYRPIGASVNSDAFYQAFGVKPGDKMYKPSDKRIRIW